jgi:peptidoglycan/LPS O-acetylase OafA/YrhL
MSRTLPAGTLANVTDHQPGPAETDDGPVTLRVAILLLWAESALVAALAAVEFGKLVTGHPQKPGLAAVLAAMIAGTAVLLALLGRWLARRRRWARGPAIVLQLLALPVAYFMITGAGGLATRAGGVLIAAVALVGAGLLLAPSSRLGLTIR